MTTMMLPSLAFLFAATVLAITPGPGITYVVARTVSGGRTEGIASCFGTAVGGLFHVLAAALGLSLIVARSAIAFSIIKYLGAAYLIYLGIVTLASRSAPAELPTLQRLGARRALRDGIVVEALNVKTAMFFLAFIPQFVSTHHALAPQFVVLGVICVALNTSADVLAVLLADRFVTTGAARRARERLLSRVSGTTMLCLGCFLALARREA
jgi:threonine/homoserine/homoserine lactone efflux protein